jgi:hypothetical protein
LHLNLLSEIREKEEDSVRNKIPDYWSLLFSRAVKSNFVRTVGFFYLNLKLF